jgi:hypothetical protein
VKIRSDPRASRDVPYRSNWRWPAILLRLACSFEIPAGAKKDRLSRSNKCISVRRPPAHGAQRQRSTQCSEGDLRGRHESDALEASDRPGRRSDRRRVQTLVQAVHGLGGNAQVGTISAATRGLAPTSSWHA